MAATKSSTSSSSKRSLELQSTSSKKNVSGENNATTDIEDSSFEDAVHVSPSRHRLSCFLMISAITWSGMHWGFVSFSSTILHNFLSYTEIGTFVPMFGVIYILCTFVLGTVADRLSHKLLLVIGAFILVIGHLAFLTAEYWIMLAGFALIGIGYAPWTLVPYVQIRLLAGSNKERYNRWYMAVELLFVVSFSFGRLMMMLSTTALSPNSPWGWRFPWTVSAGMLTFHAILIILFGKYRVPRRIKMTDNDDDDNPKANKNKNALTDKSPNSGMTYMQKIRSFYLNPISSLLVAASVFNGYSNYAVAAWAPTIATELFEGQKTRAQINVTISMAVLCAWPLGMILIVSALKKAADIKWAVRIACAFVTAASCALVGYALANATFVYHIMFLVCFAMCANYPMVFYKQIPEVLGMPAEVKVFALSRFTLVYSIFGDVAGWLVTGVLIDSIGVSNTLWVLVVISVGAVWFWGIPTVWSFLPTGPVAERALEQAATDRSLKNWALLSSITIKKARTANILRDALFNGRGTKVLELLMLRNVLPDSPNSSVGNE